MPPHWNPGDSIIQRSLPAGRVGYLRALTVVEDTDDLIALYIRPGAPCKRPRGERGGPGGRILLNPRASRGHDDWAWRDHHVLLLYRPGDAHSVQLFRRDGDNVVTCWYVDLHQPFRRTPLGFDSRDQILDAVVSPDRRTWRWKDEDEMAWMIEQGRFSAAEAAMIRVEGERAVERLLRDPGGFYSRRLDWAPDPSWALPSIPPGWDLLFGENPQGSSVCDAR